MLVKVNGSIIAILEGGSPSKHVTCREEAWNCLSARISCSWK